MPLILSKTDPQSLGSLITYYRRYQLAALVGICPDDDDGEKAQEGYRAQAKKTQAPAVAVKQIITKEQAIELLDIVKDTGIEYQQWFFAAMKKEPYNANTIYEMPANCYTNMKKAVIEARDAYLSKMENEQAYSEKIQ